MPLFPSRSVGPQAWIPSVGSCLLPEGVSLQLEDASKDLGIAFRFRAHFGRGQAELRLQENRARLHRLEKLPWSPLKKLRLLCGSVWPAALYGLESHVLPEGEVSRLRTQAARAVLGRKPARSLFLALCALAPFLADPEPYLLCQHLQCLARTLTVAPAMGREWIDSTVLALERSLVSLGPATALAIMLPRNAWVLKPSWGGLRATGRSTCGMSQVASWPSLFRVPGRSLSLSVLRIVQACKVCRRSVPRWPLRFCVNLRPVSSVSLLSPSLADIGRRLPWLSGTLYAAPCAPCVALLEPKSICCCIAQPLRRCGPRVRPPSIGFKQTPLFGSTRAVQLSMKPRCFFAFFGQPDNSCNRRPFNLL